MPGTGAVSPTGAGGNGGGGGGAGGSAHGEAGPSTPTPEQLFNAFEAPLVMACGTCHGTSTATGPKWLLGPNRYATVVAYPGIIVPDPENSILLTVDQNGMHPGGPGLSNAAPVYLSDQVANWLAAEAAILSMAPLPSTKPFPLKNGPNTVNISRGGVNGASMSFTVALDGATITFTDMTITAPASTGLEIVHPIFAIDTGADSGPPTPDVADSFSNLDQTVPAGQTQPLGVGLFVLDVDNTIGSDWTSADQIVIQFTSLTKVSASGDGGTDGSAGGCKAVATFTADAVPAIQANTCLTCHQGENAEATTNLDLTMIGTDNAAACAQALLQVNLTDPTQSNIIQAPTGGIPAHPFKGASANFKTMMLDWIMAE
jgi:hypothetical protein